ncbi:ATP-dependent helicase HrpB [Fluviispira multicolorata]|uniref:ATP-dependent helicase HrpB n=1 Tax=Fluviispira multicolorata TaxID=2654512 RepID=A0A833JD76_9BACT|nr:ATP-dependent helicase HrpB [Fluviispira multicolorata]KAB8031758.1 ATP-dependent helicase HrpB [Fluviispira multicolorata]
MSEKNGKLPTDELLPALIADFQLENSLIVQATPGAGKTTRIPVALINVTKKTILVLEPRRLAARLSAERVAHEIGEQCGETIGYHVRYDKCESARTRVKYITEGIFSRLILEDPELKDISCVIIDEFHERHVHTDIALMLVNLLQKSIRPDLKLIIMSATLDTFGLQNYLPNAKVHSSLGRTFPIEIEHLEANLLHKKLPNLIYDAIESLLNNPKYSGDILVFLSGAYEIQKTHENIKNLANKYNAIIFQLKADLSPVEQQKVFRTSEKRKIILSTNVAETSVTIEGVTGVIDCGLAKIAGHASWSGLPTLDTLPISQSSCIQRSGRAGRTQAGIAKRLYTSFDFQMRPTFQKPEIQRVDLTQTLLEMKIIEKKLKLKNTNTHFSFPWFDAPPQNILHSCSALLQFLNAFDENNNITKIGIEIAQYPLHPRLGRILYEAHSKNIFSQAIVIVSLINEGSILKRGIQAPDVGESDLYFQFNLIKNYVLKNEYSLFEKSIIETQSLKRVETHIRHLCQQNKIKFTDCFKPVSIDDLSYIILMGYPDRVCQIRKQNKVNLSGKKELNLCLGGGAFLSQSSVVQDSEFLIAIDAEESTQALSQANSTQIRICHGINPEILIAAPAYFIQESEDYIWDENAQRVRSSKKTLYGKLTLEEIPIRQHTNKHEEILLKELASAWPKPFEDDNALRYLTKRIGLAKLADLTIYTPNFSDEDFKLLLCHICENKKSFDEILDKDLEDYLDELLPYETKKLLNEFFPSHIVIGKGRKVKINYEEDKPPWVASRLQDFFGTLQTPRICKESIPLVVHLLAPNMQAVQVTTDLAGFWARGYLEIKKELSRKYPRHSWPDDPKTAEPPEYVMRRKRK